MIVIGAKPNPTSEASEATKIAPQPRNGQKPKEAAEAPNKAARGRKKTT